MSEGLGAAWEAGAGEWTRWARSRELDHPFWELNLPAFLELLPPPGRLTLDVACGEGRLARELLRLGHNVVGVDSSPSLAAAARAQEPSFELHVADATEMPLADGAADLVVAMMALMTMDDMRAVVREVARVLDLGGRFCIALLHPFASWEDAGVASYFETARYEKLVVREPDVGRMTFHDVHRPLRDYFDALADAGFVVERLAEPAPGERYVSRFPEVAGWRDRPFLLHLSAVAASPATG
ncbi:MAG TPA: class I SAM-dependent methyltransferase [Solirubrobacteraceae bacterium]|nr:class I SAM-dependent methyltransferase [Solirubrobacteraceae bacterium]